MSVSRFSHILFIMVILLLPLPSHAAPTATEMMAIAQLQLAAPAEFAQGEMQIYQHNRLAHTYQFVLGRLWEETTQTESVRVDFHSPVALELGESSHSADNRYLLRRTAQTPASQWLYLPALRRVRITPYRPAERVLTSDYFFYDLTWALDLSDFHYQFSSNAEQQHTVSIDGDPSSALAPYRHVHVVLAQQGNTYLVTELTVTSPDNSERTLRFADFREVSPGYYRPQTGVWTSADGRTELTFPQWVVRSAPTTLFSPSQLETQSLTIPN